MPALAGFIDGTLQPFAQFAVELVSAILAIELLVDQFQAGEQPLTFGVALQPGYVGDALLAPRVLRQDQFVTVTGLTVANCRDAV